MIPQAGLPRKVAFIDNGFAQRRKNGVKGALVLEALSKHFGGHDVSLALSPFFWIEISGISRSAIELMDDACAALPSLTKPEETQKWLETSFKTLIHDATGIGQILATEVAKQLPNTLEHFVPALGERFAAMWNDGQKDCAFQKIILQHLAIDRLAVSLSRKNSKATQENNLSVGGQVIQFVTQFLNANPSISPYRMLLLTWEPVYSRTKLAREVNHELREKSDLLDGDLVTRSVLRLDRQFDSPLILTSDDLDEFQSRRNHLASACLYINDRIKEMGFADYGYEPLELTAATVCYVRGDDTYTFVQHNLPTP